MESIDLISIASIAFLGSFGHCIGMCGGIVIAYSSVGSSASASRLRQGLFHILYSLGRVTTYTLLGAIFGALGKAFAFNASTKGTLFVLAGLAMVFAGLSLSGKIRF